MMLDRSGGVSRLDCGRYCTQDDFTERVRAGVRDFALIGSTRRTRHRSRLTMREVESGARHEGPASR